MLFSGLCILLACSDSPDTMAIENATPWRQPGDVVDSILPMPEYLRRFRDGVPEVTVLRDGDTNRESLARRFLDAVGSRDTAAIQSMLVSRDEFAWLVFPNHIYHEPPYELDPAYFWMQLGAESAKGLGRVLERHGGQTIALNSLDCSKDTLQSTSQRMELWGPCTVSYTVGDSVLTRALFGSMLEWDGRVKFLSYSNDF